jgi:hypothetical protein
LTTEIVDHDEKLSTVPLTQGLSGSTVFDPAAQTRRDLAEVHPKPTDGERERCAVRMAAARRGQDPRGDEK